MFNSGDFIFASLGSLHKQYRKDNVSLPRYLFCNQNLVCGGVPRMYLSVPANGFCNRVVHPLCPSNACFHSKIQDEAQDEAQLSELLFVPHPRHPTEEIECSLSKCNVEVVFRRTRGSNQVFD